MQRLQPKRRLSGGELRSSLNSLIYDGMFSQAMAVLAGGPILAAYALTLGADNFYIGLIAALSFFAELVQLPAIYLVERLRRRKYIVVTFSLASRMFIALIALIPLLPVNPLDALLLFLAGHYLLAKVSSTAWNSWMRDLVPLEIRGMFYARRMRLSLALSAALAIAAGYFLDRSGSIEAYSLVFLLAFLLGMLSTFFVSRMEEPEMLDSRFSLRTILEPFEERNFRNLVYFVALWSLASNMVLPFLTVYMFRVLNLSVAVVMVLNVVSQLTSIYFLRFLGEISDAYGNKPLLAIAGSVFSASIFLWTFSTMPAKHALTLPLIFLLHISLGFAVASINLCSANIAAKLSPPARATSYLATLALVTALFSGIGALVSGRMLDFFLERRLSLVIQWFEPRREVDIALMDFTGYDFHFLIAFLITLLALHRLAFVREAGEAPTRVVRNELMSMVRRDLRGVATVGGVHLLSPRIIYAPLLGYTRRLRRKKRYYGG
ncbi:MFS transporter [Candidatus Pyrohabitans sp.]